jgi:hypothetical protein
MEVEVQVQEEIIVDSEKENIKTIINELLDHDNREVSLDTTNQTCEYFGHDQNEKENDTAWITEHERLSTIQENYLREPMDSIHAYFLYINRNQYIEKIIHDKVDLVVDAEKKASVLSKEKLLQIIQAKKIRTPFSKYNLIDIVAYIIDLEPDHIQSYSKNENYQDKSFLHTVSILEDIRVDNSIFIFHEINAIYFFFEETELINHRHTLKSILKNTTNSESAEKRDKTTTMKVRIQLNTIDNRVNKAKKNKTRSRIHTSLHSTRKHVKTI